MRYVITKINCRLDGLCHIFLLCFVMRYVSNLLYMHDGLDVETTTTLHGPSAALQKQLLAVIEPNANIFNRANMTVEIVDTTAWAKPSNSYEINATDLWENNMNDVLPPWLINYFRWHKEQTSSGWDLSAPLKHKYLYVTCLKDYQKCGGAADRLLRYSAIIFSFIMSTLRMIYRFSHLPMTICYKTAFHSF
jgi:hypothetical protein